MLLETVADPHGTHRICLEILFKALKKIKKENLYERLLGLALCQSIGTEWDIHVKLEMAVPISPDQVAQKRNSILYHQSQKDHVMFQGEDNPRILAFEPKNENRDTALKYNELGMAEYESMEAFKKVF